MGLTARHTGTCTRCNGPIEPGMEISWPRTKQEEGKEREYYHSDCSKPYGGIPMEIETIVEGDDDEADPMEAALKAMQEAIKAKNKAPKIDPAMLRAMVEEIITEQGVIRIEIKKPGETFKPSPGVKHKNYPRLLRYLSMGEHVYMYGPHGSGKSHAAEQAAKDLDFPFYLYSGTPQSPKSDIVGYLDASRELARTQFLEAFEHGGVFVWEELDATAVSMHTLINIALSSKVMAFPHGIIRQHENFRFIGCGNTCGLGANPSYPERRPFDQSFADRFAYIEWTYDEKLEDRITAAISDKVQPWVEWVQSVRKWAKANYPAFTPSPRASIRIAKIAASDFPGGIKDELDCVLWHGNKELAEKAIKNCPLPI